MYFKSKLCKMCMYKRESLDEGFACRKGEGTVIDVEQLEYLIGGKMV